MLGYRSPKLQLDFRTNDLGIVFKDIHFSPLESSFSITAVGPSHTVEVNFWFYLYEHKSLLDVASGEPILSHHLYFLNNRFPFLSSFFSAIK